MFWSVSISRTPVLSAEDNEEPEIVKRAMAGDRTAFEELFQRYNGGICRYLAHLVGIEDGQDLAQETFLKAWQGLPDLREVMLFKPWLYSIATNLAYDHERRRRNYQILVRAWLLENGASESARGTNPEEIVAEAEHIDQALARLPSKFRASLLLQHVAGFSQHEIAKILDIGEKSVATYTCNGRKRFREAYQRIDGKRIEDPGSIRRRRPIQ